MAESPSVVRSDVTNAHEDGSISSILPSGLPKSGPQCTFLAGLTLTSEAAKDFNCSYFSGDIYFEYSDANKGEDLLLNVLESLTGNLILNGASNYNTITLSSLTSIDGTLDLTGLQQVTLGFPLLQNVQKINASDTLLTSLSIQASDSPIRSISTLIISNNPSLTTVSLPVQTIGDLIISNNTLYPNITFTNLQSASNISASTMQRLDLPSLASVTGTLIFDKSTTNPLNLSSLTYVGSDLEITNQYSLNNLTLPKLQSVGGSKEGGNFLVHDNHYASIINLPNLTDVSGDIQFIGDFNNISMPKLTSVKNGLDITANSVYQTISVETPLDCTSFLSTMTPQITNQLICNTQTGNPSPTTSALFLTNSNGQTTATIPPTSAPTSTTTTTTNPPHTHHTTNLSPGAKAGIGIAAALFFLIIIGLLVYILRRRSHKKTASSLSQLERDQSKKLDYSPMIGESSTGHVGGVRDHGYQDVVGGGKGEGRELGGGLEGRPISPVSVGSGVRRSFGSRSVSPESVDRVPLGDGGRR